MAWIGVLLALVLSVLALIYVVWPLLSKAPAPVLVENDKLTDLLARKDATLAAIKDLEFDYRVGKLSEEDYQRYDQRLRRQAIALIQQIEQIAPESSAVDDAVEAEIARRRKTTQPTTTSPTPTSATDAELEAEISRRRRTSQPAPVLIAQSALVVDGGSASVAPRFCTNCGNRLEPQHKFCALCGAAVGAVLPKAE